MKKTGGRKAFKEWQPCVYMVSVCQHVCEPIPTICQTWMVISNRQSEMVKMFLNVRTHRTRTEESIWFRKVTSICWVENLKEFGELS